MKVFITGATGLVGAHTTLALLAKGHEVRLLVRNKAVAMRYFDGRRGSQGINYVVGNMCDKEFVRKSMQGCDAVVHSAAMVSLDPRKAREIYASNLESISSVVASAAGLGISRIVYVSSVGAFFDPNNSRVDELTPLAIPREAYSRSKRDCEAHVRQLQEEGAPIQITYPSGIFGPDDPKLNESNHSILSLLKVVPRTSTGIQFVDARDLADVHVQLIECPARANFSDARLMVGGHFYPWRQFHELLEKVTGRQIWAPGIPAPLLRTTGKVMDYAKRMLPLDIPITSESMAIVTQWREVDSSKLIKNHNFTFRKAEDTLRDTIEWLYLAGHAERDIVGLIARNADGRGEHI